MSLALLSAKSCGCVCVSVLIPRVLLVLEPPVFVEVPIYLCVYASVSCQLHLYTLCLAPKAPVTLTLVKVYTHFC